MSRFEKSIQLAQEVYLNKHPEKDEIISGEKTNQIFKEKGESLFNEPTKKKPGIFTKIKDTATGAASKLSNMHRSLANFNRDAEEVGTIAAAGMRHDPTETPDEEDPNSLFSQVRPIRNQQQADQAMRNRLNQNRQGLQQQQRQQQQAKNNNKSWETYTKKIWDKMDQADRRRFNNDMNEYMIFQQKQARGGGQQ
jgi:hypothetical protein